MVSSRSRRDKPAIRYINTDLDLVCAQPLAPIVEFLGGCGIYCLHCDQESEGTWQACLEVNDDLDAPEETIRFFLNALETMSHDVRMRWDECEVREFNVGYDSGEEPWAFDNGIDARTLGRVAALGAGLRITVYPPDRGGRVRRQRSSKSNRTRGDLDDQSRER